MNSKTKYSILTAIVIIATLVIKDYISNQEQIKVVSGGVTVKANTNEYFLPTSTTGQTIHHQSYSLSYSEPHEQAEWVFYEIKKERVLGLVSRTDDFRSDNYVSTNSATLSDYKGSGYDRGHLAPAHDFSFNKDAMSESFYMSNMSPQNPSFNRGIWGNLEKLVRSWHSFCMQRDKGYTALPIVRLRKFFNRTEIEK